MKHSKTRLGAVLALIIAIYVVVSGCGAPAAPAAQAPAAAAQAVDQAAAQPAALALPVNIDAKITNDIRNRDDVILLRENKPVRGAKKRAKKSKKVARK